MYFINLIPVPGYRGVAGNPKVLRATLFLTRRNGLVQLDFPSFLIGNGLSTAELPPAAPSSSCGCQKSCSWPCR